MIRLSRLSILKKVLLIVGLAILAQIVVATIHTNSSIVNADSTCESINSGSENDYEGLNVTLTVEFPDGTTAPVSGTGDYVNVQSFYGDTVAGHSTIAPVNTPRAAIDYVDPNVVGDVITSTQNDSFYLYGVGGPTSNCYGDVLLGYGSTSADTDWRLSSDIVLDCDESTGQFSVFRVTGQGTPANAPYGGYWGAGTEVGPRNGYTAQVSLVYYANPPPTPTKPPPTPCAVQNTTPSVTLPQGNEPNEPNETSSTPPSLTTSDRTVYKEVPNGNFEINSAQDQWGTAITTTASMGTYQDSSSFQLNYANYVNQYPYDPHTTTVQYNEKYNQTIYTPKYDYTDYECPSGWDGGGINNDTECYHYELFPPSCSSTTSTGQCDGCSGYNDGYNSYYEECEETVYQSPNPVVYYDYSVGPTTTAIGINTTYNGAPVLNECSPRDFTLTSQAPVSVTLSGDEGGNERDNPTTVTVDGSVKADFSLPDTSQKVHNLCEVNGVTTHYYLYYLNPNNPAARPVSLATLSQQNSTYPSSGPASCTGATTSTGPPQPQDQRSITLGSPLEAGDEVCAQVEVVPDQGEVNYQGAIEESSGSSTYPSSETTACSTIIGAQPYLKAFGGDVMAGTDSNYVSGCYDTSSGIESWNQGGSGSYGAGTTRAALATGAISYFASGQNVLNMFSPLTFSNSPSSHDGSYGTSSNDCAGPDYYELAQSIPGAATCPATIPGKALGLNDHYICYTTNSVTITAPITYDSIPTGTPVSEFPSFEIVVDGGAQADINIKNTVDQLAGTYIDEGGTINDTNGGLDIRPASDTNTDIDNTCSGDRLVIDGSFIANNIEFNRTYGTLHDANDSAAPSDPNAAEEFDYYPINWLIPGNQELDVQSITSLPPVL